MTPYELEVMKAILISILKMRESLEIRDSCRYYLYLPHTILSYKNDYPTTILEINSLFFNILYSLFTDN